ncbi:NAD-dependent succinate-semialdehyde dehydrogenase [Kineococcus gynurae]|uniref:NAD-dependent succinate-semialdehyde dehydrogenase n=1 Tax=Kineococcus gynurae TaxID=452979 RepID=A0ABV5LTA7_9ACTN
MTTFAVVNPTTGERGEPYPLLDADGIEAALARAQAAFEGDSRSLEDRCALLRRIAQVHRDRAAELADAIVAEMGKPREQAIGEVDFCADIYEYYADIAPQLLAEKELPVAGGEGTAVLRSNPVGVLFGIMPWNFPAYQVARFAAPNLVLGNTIVLKHAPQCPSSALLLEEFIAEAGAPDGAYVNVFVDNDQSAEIIADPRVRGVSLTGSERAGAAVAEVAGRNLKKVVLELGGSDPFIVLSADDLDSVVDSAVAARLDNNGQACNAAKRFIVAEGIHDEFLRKFVAKLSEVTVGDPNAEGTTLGPLSSASAAETLRTQVENAIADGASVALRGEQDGTSFAPVVLTDVKPGTKAYTEEFFGPVAVVHKVADEAAAVQLANDTPFGLGSYVFTTDPKQADRVADALDVGMVFVNAVGAEGAELPFGGTKRSGYGRELGPLGLQEFCNVKMIRKA